MSIQERRVGTEGERTFAVPEQLLRSRAITLVQSKPLSQFLSIRHVYAQLGLFPTESQIKNNLLLGIHSASRSDRWACGPDGVQMGYYENSAGFYTNLLHEVAHDGLNRLGRTHEDYIQNPILEESFCWQSAQDTTALLGLPYAKDEAAIHFKISLERQKIKYLGASKDMLESLVEEAKQLSGFSDHERVTTHWTPQGVPFLQVEI